MPFKSALGTWNFTMVNNKINYCIYVNYFKCSMLSNYLDWLCPDSLKSYFFSKIFQINDFTATVKDALGSPKLSSIRHGYF
jgi:hypothetical protein